MICARSIKTLKARDMNTAAGPICVLARIAVVATDEGGKNQPFTKNYRPNHNFGSAENNETFIGQIEVPEGSRVYPGETHDLVVRFMDAPGLNALLEIGRTWRIQEGRKLVARAQVLRRQVEA